MSDSDHRESFDASDHNEQIQKIKNANVENDKAKYQMNFSISQNL